MQSIYDLLLENVNKSPDALCAVHGERRMTFKDVKDEVDLIARALLANGVVRGDRVATLSPPSMEFWLTYLAATSIGAVWHGINPVYRDREFSYLLQDASPKVVFSVSPFDGRHYDSELQATENEAS